MKSFIFSLSAVLLFVLAGCEEEARISVPARYEKGDVRFSHPQNWRVTKDVEQKNVRYLFVESPGDAIFIAQIYPKKNAVSLDEFIERFSAAAREKTPIGNLSKSSFSPVVEPTSSPGKKGVKESFSIELLGQSVPHVREYYGIDAGDKVAYLIFQTASEESSKVEPGFHLILSSFLAGKPESARSPR